MVLTVILLIVGLILIVKGGDFFVDAASWMAEKTGIPKLVVGATVVALATTLPEILVSMIAAVQGSVDMAIGNAVGSVTANLGLIMAIAIICMPGKITARDYRGKFILLLVAALLVVIGGVSGGINLPMACILLVVAGLFFWDNVRLAMRANRAGKAGGKGAGGAGVARGGRVAKAAKAKTGKKAKVSSKKQVWWNIVKFVLGAAGIVGGAELLVHSGTELATAIGVSERIISVTLIAVGTSLPELVTTITAIVKKEGALGFGNILGANIIDLSLIMPLCAIVSGQTLTISATSAAIDLPACLIVAAIAIIPTSVTKKFSRWQGLAMLVAYAVYMVVTCIM